MLTFRMQICDVWEFELIENDSQKYKPFRMLKLKHNLSNSLGFYLQTEVMGRYEGRTRIPAFSSI